MAENNAPGSPDLKLADAIEALRTELEKTLAEGPHHQLRFRISDVTLTLQTVARKSKDGKLGIGWYVISAGVGASSEGIATQTLVLNLTPLVAQEPLASAANVAGGIAAAVAEAEVDSRVAEPLIKDIHRLSTTESDDLFALVKVPGMQLPASPGGPGWVPPVFLTRDYPVVELDPALHSPAITHIKDVMAAQIPGTVES